MPDNANLIESSQDEIFQIVEKLHKAGVRYSAIYYMLMELVKGLDTQSYAEEWLRMYNRPDETQHNQQGSH